MPHTHYVILFIDCAMWHNITLLLRHRSTLDSDKNKKVDLFYVELSPKGHPFVQKLPYEGAPEI